MAAVEEQSVPPADAPKAISEKAKARREKMRLFFKSPSALIGLFIILVWVVCAIGGTHITPKDPFDIMGMSHEPPGSPGYLLGTDKNGSDILSRIMYGARDVLIAAPLAAVLGVALGSLLGLLMGYYRGFLDEVLGLVISAFLALPLVLVGLLALSAAPPDPPSIVGVDLVLPGLEWSTEVVILVIGLLFAPIVARTVRAAVLAERENDYVQSAKLRGESGLYIMTREILPNVTSPIVVEFTVRIGYAIFAIAFLSFIGVGIQPPTPDWGLMISDEYHFIIGGYWWGTVFPALAIASLVIAVNLIADRLQEVMEL